MEGIFLLLGTNIDDKRANLLAAKTMIQELDMALVRESALYETAPWGNKNQDSFYNQVIEIDTAIEPAMLIQEILTIESKMGRIRTTKWEARLIDIDILFYKNEIVDTQYLVIPHPGIQFRRFTLEPLCELIPEQKHPLLNQSINQLLLACPDKSRVQKIN